MPPTVVAVGTLAAGATTAVTPPFPAGIAANDILLGVAESVGGENYTPPAGWAHVASDGTAVSPVVQGINTQLTVIWLRYTGSETAASWGDAGNHNMGRIIAIRGCPTVGNPWNVVGVASSATSSTAASFPGATTTVADTLVLEIIATGTDTATGQLATITNANYSSITSQMNNWTTAGTGGGFALLSGVKATPGATGASTGTLTTAATKAYMTLVMMNAPAPPPGAKWKGLPPGTRRSQTAVHQAANW